MERRNYKLKIMNKFDELYNKIITETTEKKEKFLFDTYQEAREFLTKNYNGHGPVYDINGELIETCRCPSFVHKQLNIPYVQCKQTVEEHEKEIEDSLNDYNLSTDGSKLI